MALVLLPLVLWRGIFNYQAGNNLPVRFQLTGGVLTTMNVTGWEGAREVELAKVTNTATSGGAAKLATTRDGRGTITIDHDADFPHYALPLGIIEGVTGIVLEFITPTKPIQTPISIKSVKFVSRVGDALHVTVEWEYNQLAGLYVVPSN